MEQNLSAYYTFYQVAEAGNISSAAKKLFVSQPAVSKSISKLETSLDTTLFFRTKRGVSLTPSGQLLYDRLKDAFRSIELGEEQLKYESQKEQEHLTIGVSTTLCKYILLPYLKDFIKDNPHLRISISCQSSFETIEALSAGKIDIGLIGEAPLDGDFVFSKTNTISDIFVTTQSYLDHLTIRTGMDYTNPENFPLLLSSSTLMLMDNENLSRIYIDKYIKEHRLVPQNILEVSTMDLLIEFTTIGLGVSCVISDFVEDELKREELITLPLPFTIPSRNIGLVYKRAAQNTPVIKRFLKDFSV